MKVKAIAKSVRISPSKVKLVVDMVRGKKVEEALQILKFVPTPAARAVSKVIKSAAANAENNYEMTSYDLKVTDILADPGPMLKRYKPQARGRVNPILRRSTHITVYVAEEEKKSGS